MTPRPQPERELNAPSEQRVSSALQQAWNEFCDDTGCFPDCIEMRGRKLYADFNIGNFSRTVSELLRAGASGPSVKRARKAQGMTQRVLAEAVGVGVPYICRIERGHEQPSPVLLDALAAALQVDVNALLGFGRV